MRSIEGEVIRFLVAGGANTAITYLVYLSLLHWTGYITAFTISFLTGIIFAFVIYSVLVFKSPIIWRKLLQYPIIYVLQYVAGLALLAALVEYLGLDKHIAPIVNIILLTPATFVLNRWFLSKKVKQ